MVDNDKIVDGLTKTQMYFLRPLLIICAVTIIVLASIYYIQVRDVDAANNQTILKINTYFLYYLLPILASFGGLVLTDIAIGYAGDILRNKKDSNTNQAKE